MKLDRKVVKVRRGGAGERKEASPHTPGELLAFVWELTAEAYSLGRDFDAESRLQRDVVHVIRPPGRVNHLLSAKL
jgi:hypothetical protein